MDNTTNTGDGTLQTLEPLRNGVNNARIEELWLACVCVCVCVCVLQLGTRYLFLVWGRECGVLSTLRDRCQRQRLRADTRFRLYLEP